MAMQTRPMDAMTINEAAETTGWSARMLRYIERAGLVRTARSASGYRLYGPAELQRLRTLRELLRRFDVGLGEIGFALRLQREPELRKALDAWLSPAATEHEGHPPSLGGDSGRAPNTNTNQTMEAA
jgi:MerR family transcriptional regulator, copper efflux regulator